MQLCRLYVGGCIGCSDRLETCRKEIDDVPVCRLQAVARTTSPLPDGKCLVAAIDYEPPPVNLSLFDV
jgi:hypothetical protein